MVGWVGWWIGRKVGRRKSTAALATRGDYNKTLPY